MLDPKIESVRARCTRSLTHHGAVHQHPAAALRELAAAAGPDLAADMYGEGELINGFEAEVAALLGHEAAAFMPSGTMAQQIAARLWAERKGPRAIAFHPLCHLELHEHRGYQALHGLRGVAVGSPHRLLSLADLQSIAEPLAMLLIELPQRGIGGQLPAWDELCAIAAWARDKGVALHLDGARLWESAPFYGRPHAEIAGLFDSVYVSFYKGLGGIAGSILAGPKAFIAESRVWQRRHGGNLISLFPYVLSAKAGLALRRERMPEYVKKARSIAARLAAFPWIDIVPEPPQTNMMHLHLRGPKDRLEAAALALAEETGTWLFGRLQPSPLPGRSIFELSAGDATLALSDDEIVALFASLYEKAQAPAG